MTAGILFAVFVLAILFPVGLYVLVRAEHDDRDRLDRESAERVARRDDDGDNS